jgi:hypothetical protein
MLQRQPQTIFSSMNNVEQLVFWAITAWSESHEEAD